MAAIQDLVLRFKVQGDGAVKALKDDIKDLVSQSNPLNNSLGNVAGKMGLVANGAAAAAAAFALLGMRAFDLGDQLDDLSNSTGISAGQLMNLRNSLVEAGGDVNSFEKAATKLAISVGESASGNEKLQKSFKDLGVFVTDANGKVRDTGDILEDVLAALSNIQDPTIRQAKAIELLGKEAAKIDWSNVQAGRNIEFDEAAKNMAALKGEIDKLRIAIDEGLLVAFGNLAQGLNKFGIENLFARMTEGVAGFLEKIPLVGAAFEFLNKKARESRLEAEKAITAQQEEAAGELARLLGRAPAPRRGPTRVPGGGFGSVPEATLKAVEDNKTRIEQSGIEARRLLALQSADEIQKVQINTAAELEKARTEIFNKEKLSQAQKLAEYEAKAKEIAAKGANEIAKIESDNRKTILQQRQNYQDQVNQMLGFEKSELQKVNDLIAQQPDKYKEIGDQMRANAAEQDRQLRFIKDFNKEQERQKKLSEDLRLLSNDYAQSQFKAIQDQTRQFALLGASTEREKIAINEQFDSYARINDFIQKNTDQKLIEARLNDEQGVATAEQLQMLMDFNNKLEKQLEFERSITSIRTYQGQQLFDIQREFITGWDQAFKAYADSAGNAAAQAKTYFDTFARGFEDAFVRFVKTGKLSFKDLVNSMIAEFTRLQAQKFFLQLFGDKKGQGGMLMNLFTWGKSLFGLANGGMAQGGTPYIVGERGPELFVPFSSGRVIPNNQLGMNQPQPQITNVNYTIQAVDASSFRQLVARDPAFIYAVTERGRQAQPTRRVG